jgi:hypothetical protein
MSDAEISIYASSPATSGVTDIESVFAAVPTLEPETRYRDRTLVGSGQMGRVESAYDTLLRREVAMKVLRADANEGARERFAREASITAGLEHPGIVTVHDSGTLDDGRPYYTMQLVRGGSWEPRDAYDIDEEIGRLAAIGEAVGHAHARGIVHRDLKPANIMVGDFGEVVVADWGLATFERAAEEFAETQPLTTSALTAHGAIVGTPLYMSPEQARGEPVQASADVWALGMMLFERLHGTHPYADLSAKEVLRRVRTADLPRLGNNVSPELAAIVERALALRPDARYPSGAEFAADLRNFAAGRRVGAYVYRPLDLLSRFVRAHRFALAGAAATVALLLTTGAVSYANTVLERDRARSAEAEARRAEDSARSAEYVAVEQRKANERLSGRLLAAQARVAVDAGDLAAAEFLAEAALARGESADARGVLAATGFANHPVHVIERPAPCEAGQLSTRGLTIVCPGPEAVQLYDADSLEPGARIPLSEALAAVSSIDETGRTWVATNDLRVTGYDLEGAPQQTFDLQSYDIDAQGPHLQLGVFEATQFLSSSGTLTTRRHECPGLVADVGYAGGTTLLVCRDGSARLDGAPVQMPEDDTIESTDFIVPLDDGRFVLGRDDGRVTTFDPKTGEWHTAITGARRIGNVTDLHDGLVALTTEDMDTLIWNVDTSSTVLRLPPSWGNEHARRTNGTFVSIGTALRTWRLSARRSSGTFQAEYGVSMATASEVGDVVVAGLGDGSIAVWNANDGQLRWRAYWPLRSVLKSAVVSRDGRYVLGMVAQDGRVRVFDIRSGQVANILELENGVTGGRRLLTLQDGSVWASSYGNRLLRWSDMHSDDVAHSIAAGIAEDGSASEHGAFAVWLHERTDRISRVQSGSATLTPLGAVAGAHAVDIDDSGRLLVVGRDHDVVLLDDSLAEQQRWGDLPARTIDVSIRGDGSLVAAGLRDGSILVWRVGAEEPVVRLPGHESRTSSVDFVGEMLISAGWDRTVHRWSLAPMLAPITDLRRAESRWGQPPAEIRALLEP